MFARSWLHNRKGSYLTSFSRRLLARSSGQQDKGIELTGGMPRKKHAIMDGRTRHGVRLTLGLQ